MKSKRQKLAEALTDGFVQTMKNYGVTFERGIAYDLMADVVSGISRWDITLPKENDNND